MLHFQVPFPFTKRAQKILELGQSALQGIKESPYQPKSIDLEVWGFYQSFGGFWLIFLKLVGGWFPNPSEKYAKVKMFETTT